MRTSMSPELTETSLFVPPEASLSTVLSLEAIEALRAKQREAYQSARYDDMGMLDPSMESEATARLRVQDVTDAYVVEHFGANISDPRTEATKSLLDSYSFVNSPDQQWYVPLETADSNGETMRGMDKFLRDRTPLSAAYPGATSPEKELVALEQKDQLYTELAELRDTLSSLSAKRQGRIAGKGGEAYATTRTAYMERVIALGKLENETIINDATFSEQEKHVKVIEYIFAEQAKLREQTIEKLNGTKVGRFVEWMNRGKIATRVAKGLLVGVGVGLAAAGIGALAGIAGAATIGAGVGAVGLGAWRFARSFARADSRSGRGMAAVPDMANHAFDSLSIIATPHSSTNNEYVVTAARRFGDVFESDTKNEQHKRRQSVVWGLGGLAAGIALAGGVHLLLDLNPPDVITKPQVPGVGGENSITIVPGNGDIGVIDVHEAPIISEFDSHYSIQPGEGGIHLFQRLGLTGNDWYNVQNDLLTKFPHDFYDPDGNGPIAVRIAHPGQLSASAQEYIKQKFNLG